MMKFLEAQTCISTWVAIISSLPPPTSYQTKTPPSSYTKQKIKKSNLEQDLLTKTKHVSQLTLQITELLKSQVSQDALPREQRRLKTLEDEKRNLLNFVNGLKSSVAVEYEFWTNSKFVEVAAILEQRRQHNRSQEPSSSNAKKSTSAKLLDAAREKMLGLASEVNNLLLTRVDEDHRVVGPG